MKVAVVFDNYGPYLWARVNAAGKTMPVLAVELYGCSAEYDWQRNDGAANIEFVTLLPDTDRYQAKLELIERRINEVFIEHHVTAVAIPGWSFKGALAALRWSVNNQVPAITMSESNAWDEPRKSWREAVKRRVVGLCSAGLVGGTPQAEYLEQLGMRRDRIFPGYDAVDNGYFAAEAAKWQKLKLEKLKAEIGNEEKKEPEQAGLSSSIHDPRSAIPVSPYFLASNRFIEKKNLFRLLDAYAGYLKRDRSSVIGHQSSVISDCGDEPVHCTQAPQTTDNGQPTTPPWDLCMLGDGELKPQLLAHCEKLGLHVIESAPWEVEEKAESKKLNRAERDRQERTRRARRDRPEGRIKAVSDERESPPSSDLCPLSSDLRPPSSGTVFFPGFRQIEELPRFYAHAGAFVHASTTEQWGLVVNEAMACGLPVIVSNRVGCARDLVRDGVNGFTFDPYDIEQLTGLFSRVSCFNFQLSAFGDASRAIIADWGPERFAAGLKQAVECAMKVGPKRASLLQRMILRVMLTTRFV